VRPIAPYHANKKIKEQGALLGLKRCKDAGIGGEIFWNQTFTQFLSTRREMQLTRSAIRAIGASVYKTHFLQLFDNLTGIYGNDSNRFGKSTLVDPRDSIYAGERGPLERRQVFADKRFGDHRRADLLEVPRQVERSTEVEKNWDVTPQRG
jgi:hypothetical protein